MENEMIISKKNTPIVQNNECGLNVSSRGYYPIIDEKRTGIFLDEIIAGMKDDRLITKRVISADIASAARVQSQNDQVIAACERELHRKDISEERRDALIDRMGRAADSTAYADAESRAFQRAQLDHMHKRPWKAFLGFGLFIVGCLGGAAWANARA